jgi:hypothetical protein
VPLEAKVAASFTNALPFTDQGQVVGRLLGVVRHGGVRMGSGWGRKRTVRASFITSLTPGAWKSAVCGFRREVSGNGHGDDAVMIQSYR